MFDRLFGGDTFNPEKDGQRLATQLYQVKKLMSDGQWRSLFDIADAVKAPESSVSARLRDLRKTKFGGHTVERKRIRGGTHLYRVILEGDDE